MSDPITINLTSQAPVRVDGAAWPLLANAKDWDNTHESQANRTWSLRVRQHADGRAIVYGRYTTQFQDENNRSGGELLAARDDIAAAILRVAESLEFAPSLAQECISDLPVVELQ